MTDSQILARQAAGNAAAEPGTDAIRQQLDPYLDFLLQQERSDATIRKYAADTAGFVRWAGDRVVCKELLMDWKQSLIDSGLAASTVNAKICAVNGLLRFQGNGDCALRLLRVQKATFRQASRDLTMTEYRRLQRAAALDPLKLALLETIAATGVRVSEVPFITVEAICAGMVEISNKGKIRTIPLSGKLCARLQDYIRSQGLQSGPLFRNSAGNPLTRFQIWAILKGLAKKAGVEATKVFPHNLRHLFAKTYYQKNRDIARLADLLGHTNIQTTRIYVTTTAQEQIRLLDELGLCS